MLDGIEAAVEAGLEIKLNMVAMRGVNEDEIEPMLHWAHDRGFGLTLIEGMPLGEVGIDRVDSYLPLKELHDRLRRPLHSRAHRAIAPAARPAMCGWPLSGGLLGFITPMSHNTSAGELPATASG